MAYRARDMRLERTVAIKVLAPQLSSSPEVRQRFEREAKTASQLSHPHLCGLYGVGEAAVAAAGDGGEAPRAGRADACEAWLRRRPRRMYPYVD